jgi:hypothetical protein
MLAMSSPAGAIGPTVTVTPNSGLTDGQLVTVAGSGFTIAPDVIGTEECSLGAVASYVQHCDGSTLAVFLWNGPGSDYSTSFTVQRHITTTDAGAIDCAVPDKCEILSGGAYPDTSELASDPISFTAPQVDLSIVKVRSITRVLPGQPVEVRFRAANEGPAATTWDVVETAGSGLTPISAGCQRSQVADPGDCTYSSTSPKVGHSVNGVFTVSTSPGFAGVTTDEICARDENTNDADPNPANGCMTISLTVG